MARSFLENMPVGFRFHPLDEELLNHYLRGKIEGRKLKVEVIPEVDIWKWEPWDLPDLSVIIKSDDPEWYFFSRIDRKSEKSSRCKRSTKAGFWKPTGKDRKVKSWSGRNVIGWKKTLVYYKGRASKCERTNWLMHEYRVNEKAKQGDFVLCRLFKKSDENTQNSNCNEMEPTGSSPEATPLNQAFVLTTTESDIGSVVKDGETEEDQHPLLKEYEDSRVFLHELREYNCTLYTAESSDFVYVYNEMPLQDGSYEQAVFTAEMIEELCNQQDESTFHGFRECDSVFQVKTKILKIACEQLLRPWISQSSV